MSSLRTRQKEARKEQMLEAARGLFLTNGYGKTSVEAIAEAAEVGVATVYTYFETKEGLAAAIIYKDVGQSLAEADVLAKSLPNDPVESIIAIVSVFADFNKYISAELLKEFSIQAKHNGPIYESMTWAHESQVSSIENVLLKGKKDDKITSSLDTKLAAELIIDLMDRYITRVTTSSDPAKYEYQLNSYIRLIFTNWK